MNDKKKFLKTLGVLGTGLAIVGGILSVASDVDDFMDKKDDLDSYNKSQRLLIEQNEED